MRRMIRQAAARWFCFKIHLRQDWHALRLALRQHEEALTAIGYAILALTVAFWLVLYVHALGG